MRIGPYQFDTPVLLAPMAGVTDRPFRQLCRRWGAQIAASEMIASDIRLWETQKTRWRIDQHDEAAPRVVQIAGGDPEMLARAAQLCVDRGAQIVDINMGCPVKKVCRKMAGSALLRDEDQVARILDAVVAAVDVPVTLKIRTGWDPEHRNGVRIAQLAERAGIAALAVHGRTRACRFKGAAEYETIRSIKSCVKLPVIANGDISSPRKAQEVLAYTGADGIMIGRAAQGRPWIFTQIRDYLVSGELKTEPPCSVVRDMMLAHLDALYSFYGEQTGVRVARKHISWYCRDREGWHHFRSRVMPAESADRQLHLMQHFFEGLEQRAS